MKKFITKLFNCPMYSCMLILAVIIGGLVINTYNFQILTLIGSIFGGLFYIIHTGFSNFVTFIANVYNNSFLPLNVGIRAIIIAMVIVLSFLILSRIFKFLVTRTFISRFRVTKWLKVKITKIIDKFNSDSKFMVTFRKHIKFIKVILFVASLVLWILLL